VVKNAAKYLEDYLRDEKLSIFAQPVLVPGENLLRLDLSNPGSVEFDFEIGLKPDIDLMPVINNSHLHRYKIIVTDNMVDQEVEKFRTRFGKEDEQSVVTSGENIVYVSYELCDSEGNVAEGTESVDADGPLNRMPSGLSELLMDKTPGATMVFRPVDVCNVDELAGFLDNTLKTGRDSGEHFYKMTLNKIGWLIPAEMGDEFYKAVYPKMEIKNEEEFKDKIKHELELEFGRITGERYQNEIFEYLVHQTPVPLPVNFLKRWMMENEGNPKTAAQVDQEFPGFEHQLRWQLISDKVITETGITVTREEMERDIKRSVLAYFGLSIEDEDEAPWLDGYMAKMAKDNKMMDETYRRMLIGKIFLVLELQFKAESKDISEEEFFKLADAHAAHHHHDH